MKHAEAVAQRREAFRKYMATLNIHFNLEQSTYHFLPGRSRIPMDRVYECGCRMLDAELPLYAAAPRWCGRHGGPRT